MHKKIEQIIKGNIKDKRVRNELLGLIVEAEQEAFKKAKQAYIPEQ